MKLLISLGVVAMMFFAQAADVNAATCEEKVKELCEAGYADSSPETCAEEASKTNDSFYNCASGDWKKFCKKYC